ncbi:hypothetical protein BCEP27_60354 [Burkholderia cepacia]
MSWVANAWHSPCKMLYSQKYQSVYTYESSEFFEFR